MLEQFDIEFKLETISVLMGIFGFTILGLLTGVRGWLHKIRRSLGDSIYLIFRRLRSDPLYSIAVHSSEYKSSEATNIHDFVEDIWKKFAVVCDAALREQIELILVQPSAGSPRVSNQQLINGSNTLIDLPLSGLSGDETSISQFHESWLSECDVHHFIHGDAGSGKSFFNMVLEHEVNTDKSNSRESVVVFRPQDFSRKVTTSLNNESLTIGSLDWCVEEVISKFYKLEDTTDLLALVVRRFVQDEAIIIIDGLDEIMETLSFDNRIDFIRTWIFQNSRIIFCRSSFYEANLFRNAAISHRKIWQMSAPDEDSTTRFLTSLSELLVEGTTVEATDIVSTIENSQISRDILNNPLVLTMACDVVSEGHEFGDVLDQYDLYEIFLVRIAQREIMKSKFECSYNTIMELIEDVAWSLAQIDYFDLQRDGLFDEKDILRSLGSNRERFTKTEKASLVALIERLPIFAIEITPSYKLESRYSFRHQSFQDFLVARRVIGFGLGLNKKGMDFFFQIESPSVSNFLKQRLKSLLSHTSDRYTLSENFRELLTSWLAQSDSSSSSGENRSIEFAAGQTAYYYGMICNAEQSDELVSLTSHRSFWLRRSAAIGLAFGGRDAAMIELVSELWSDFDSGAAGISSSNMAIELGFYGDQIFEEQDPTLDQGLPNCDKTIAQIGSQLGQNIEFPSWRLDLFAVIYLLEKRGVSKDSARISFEKNFEKFQDWQRDMMALKEVRDTREFKELSRVIDAYNPN